MVGDLNRNKFLVPLTENETAFAEALQDALAKALGHGEHKITSIWAHLAPPVRKRLACDFVAGVSTHANNHFKKAPGAAHSTQGIVTQPVTIEAIPPCAPVTAVDDLDQPSFFPRMQPGTTPLIPPQNGTDGPYVRDNRYADHLATRAYGLATPVEVIPVDFTSRPGSDIAAVPDRTHATRPTSIEPRKLAGYGKDQTAKINAPRTETAITITIKPAISKSAETPATPEISDDSQPSAPSTQSLHTAHPGLPPTAPNFWPLWIDQKDGLLRQCLKLMSGNMDDAQDALSEAMVKASVKFEESMDEIRNHRAWLSRIVHNACIDLHRQNKRKAEYHEDAHSTANDSMPVISHRNMTTPEQNALTGEMFANLDKALSELPEKLRRPLLMRCVQDQSYDEIADHLGLSNCAVRKRVQLARDQLRECEIR